MKRHAELRRPGGRLTGSMQLRSIAVLILCLAPGCRSSEKLAAELQSYCDLAEEMIESGAAMTTIGLLDTALIYKTWNQRSPSDGVQTVLDHFYGEESFTIAAIAPEDLTIEHYQLSLARSAKAVDLPAPRCDRLLTALMDSHRRGARLDFLMSVCNAYGWIAAGLPKTAYVASEHDKALRDALSKAIGDARHVNQDAKAFVEKILSVEPELRGRTFARDLVEWQGFELEPGDSCMDLRIHVELLYKNHLEKQETETP